MMMMIVTEMMTTMLITPKKEFWVLITAVFMMIGPQQQQKTLCDFCNFYFISYLYNIHLKLSWSSTKTYVLIISKMELENRNAMEKCALATLTLCDSRIFQSMILSMENVSKCRISFKSACRYFIFFQSPVSDIKRFLQIDNVIYGKYKCTVLNI